MRLLIFIRLLFSFLWADKRDKVTIIGRRPSRLARKFDKRRLVNESIFGGTWSKAESSMRREIILDTDLLIR